MEAKTITGEIRYKNVGDLVMKEAKDKITKIVKEACITNMLTNDEYEAMLPGKDETPVREDSIAPFKCTSKMSKKKAYLAVQGH